MQVHPEEEPLSYFLPLILDKATVWLQTLGVEFFVGRASDIKKKKALKNIVCPFRACSFKIIILSFIDFLPLLPLPRMPHAHCARRDLGKCIIL